jgi:hypothetical protein
MYFSMKYFKKVLVLSTETNVNQYFCGKVERRNKRVRKVDVAGIGLNMLVWFKNS